MILKQKSINFLNQYFKLPAIGTEQDWAIELADHTRIKEFLDSYNTITLSSDDKIALMALIFASYEDYIYKYGKEINIENKAEKILVANMSLFKELLEYWALRGESKTQNWFKVTSFARKIIQNN